MDKIKSGALFGYVECDIKVPEHLRKRLANFLPVFENKNVYRQDIGPLMLEHAEKKRVNVAAAAKVDFYL